MATDVKKPDPDKTREFVEQAYESSIIEVLTQYIRIPNKSPSYEPEWEKLGHMDEAVKLLAGWAEEHGIPGMKMSIERLPGRTPVIFIEVPASGGARPDDTVLLYGHLDKQPEMHGWDEDKGPWTPVLQDDKLYGRGGADDGYAIFASLTALRAMREQGIPHTRCVILIEGCEESGSYDLPHYIEALKDRIGTPSLVVCLDSGCGNYDQMWCTTSLRGLLIGTLRVDILREGVHSGDASGVVASSFRILRNLLDRLEDSSNGAILPKELYIEIPRDRVEQAVACASILNTSVFDKFPFIPGAGSVNSELIELVLNRTWRPTLSITGVDGLPSLQSAGNVLRPFTSLRLSMRLPPTLDSAPAATFVKDLLEKDPPYGAKVSFLDVENANGWNAPPVSPWLEDAMHQASQAHFGRDAAFMGEGGSIPFMGMLGEAFPEAQFLITGVLGPMSNAHGPNEFLHIPTAKRLTCCVADVLTKHYLRD
ncbi:M20 family metallopeptidase [Haliangium sp.]|uniref:M20 family metallopeptidase n=1 Tax=Haliangium sp. TaxID=2663208 RepID=UPI003D0BDBE5